MAKINSTKKVVIEEFPEDVRGWMRKLLDPLNRFLEQAYFALVKGLTIGDNLKAQVNSYTVTTTQTYPISIGWNLNERPTAYLVAQIQNPTGAAVPAYAMEWYYDNRQVKVTLTGLTAATKYNVTFLGIV